MTPCVFNIAKTTQIHSEQQEPAAAVPKARSLGSSYGTCIKQASLPSTGLEDSCSRNFRSLIPASCLHIHHFKAVSSYGLFAAVPLTPFRS